MPTTSRGHQRDRGTEAMSAISMWQQLRDQRRIGLRQPTREPKKDARIGLSSARAMSVCLRSMEQWCLIQQ